MFRAFFLAVLVGTSLFGQAQISITQFQKNANLDLERKIYQFDVVRHPSVQQWVINIGDDSLENIGNHWQKKKYEKWFGRKLFNEDLLKVDTTNFSLKINPLVNFQFGVDNEDTTGQRLSTNSRGILIEATVGKKFGFYTSFWENQSFFPAYITNYIASNGIVPGQGRVKPFKKIGFDYARSSAVLHYAPTKWLFVQGGHGKNFYGNGYRSLLQSDYAFNYPYLKVGLSLFDGKLLYQPSIASLQHLQRLPATTSSEAQFVRKAGTFHVLNFQPHSRVEIGLFEGGVWQNWDSNGTVQLPANFYVPIAFLNSGINGLESANYKGIVGLNGRVSPLKTLALYGQIGMSNQGTSRFASQIGVKYFDAFKVENLFIHGEYNTIDNGVYSHSLDPALNYNHYNEGIANFDLGASNEVIARVNYSFRDVFVRFKYNHQNRNQSITTIANSVSVVTNTLKAIDITSAELGYLFNKRNNMMVLFGVQNRAEESVLSATNSQWVYVSFRTELQNLYYDF